MADLIDVLDEAGLRTGEILSRAEVHRLGKRHRAVRLYLFNERGEILLQQRGAGVDHAPHVYSISVVGHVAAGEASAWAVRRELKEELGIDAALLDALRIHFLFSHYQEATLSATYIDCQFNDIYVARAAIDLAQLRVDAREVAAVTFVPWADFLGMVAEEGSVMGKVYGREVRDLVYFLAEGGWWQ